jgi:hypothetical protein
MGVLGWLLESGPKGRCHFLFVHQTANGIPTKKISHGINPLKIVQKINEKSSMGSRPAKTVNMSQGFSLGVVDGIDVCTVVPTHIDPAAIAKVNDRNRISGRVVATESEAVCVHFVSPWLVACRHPV